MLSCMSNIKINYDIHCLFLSISWRERLVHQSERVSLGVGIKKLITIVEAITTDSWCDSWCLLCLETLGADTSWPVSGNSL